VNPNLTAGLPSTPLMEFTSTNYLRNLNSLKVRITQVSIVTGYRLDGRDLIPGRDKTLLVSGPCLGPTQLPIQWISEALSSRIKLPGREAAHSPRSGAEIKNGGAMHPLPRMSWRSIKHRDNTISRSLIDQLFCSPLLVPGRFFCYVILYTVGRTLCTSDQPVARPLPTHRINADIYASSGSRTHDPSLRTGEDGSCLTVRPAGHCHRHRTTQTQNRRTRSGIRTHDPNVREGEDSSL
jgi:hypothetical protein